MSEPTSEELRVAGFSGHAGARDDLALRLLCAFNGIDPAKAPPGWKVRPSESTKAAWERVAAVIAQEMADFAALKVDIGKYVRMTSDQADEIEGLRAALRPFAAVAEYKIASGSIPFECYNAAFLALATP